MKKKIFEKKIKKFLISNLKKLKIKQNDIIYLGLDLTKFFLPFIKYFPSYNKKKQRF